MSGTYTFQPRQPLNPSTVRSPFSSTSTTPINSTTTSPRQQTVKTATRNANANANGNANGTANVTPNANNSAAQPKVQPHPLQLNLQSSRQLKTPQSPLYVPAVLRQTERPTAARLSRNASQASLKNASNKEKTATTLTPTLSSTISFQNAKANANKNENKNQNQNQNHQSFVSSSSGPGSASGTEEEDDIYDLLDNEAITISKEAEDEWYRSEKLGEVVGSPTREHWRADAVSPICDFPGCRTSFGIFMRRHHCRHCGHVFCASHTPSIVPLDQNARFHPNGEYGRACEMCHKAYLKWDRRRLCKLIAIERDIEEQRRWEEEGGKDAEGKTRGRAMLKPGMGGGPGMCDDPNDILNGGGIGWPQHHVGSFLSGSVPRDWSWSTF